MEKIIIIALIIYIIFTALAYKSIQKTIKNPSGFHFFYMITPFIQIIPILHFIGDFIEDNNIVDWNKFFNKF